MLNYLMVSALLLLVVGLSLPTIAQLVALLREDRGTARPALPEQDPVTSIVRATSSARLSSVRVQPASVDRAIPETQLAH